MSSQFADLAHRPLPGTLARLNPTVSLRTTRGTFFLFLPARHIVVTQFAGYIGREGAEALRDFGNRQFDLGLSVHFFHDWEALQGYDSEVRTLLTGWAVERRKSIREVVVLTRSKLVGMGVATANLATSVVGVSLRSHNERRPFEQELLRALAG